jgi:hypothetical protein
MIGQGSNSLLRYLSSISFAEKRWSDIPGSQARRLLRRWRTQSVRKRRGLASRSQRTSNSPMWRRYNAVAVSVAT